MQNRLSRPKYPSPVHSGLQVGWGILVFFLQEHLGLRAGVLLLPFTDEATEVQ